jgi:peptide deformylase
MAVRPIVLYPDPVLLRPTERVERFDDDLRALVEDMADTLRAAPGIGLAANQIGDSRRVCVVDLSAGERPDARIVLVNPQIVSATGRQVGEEGCLSFPDITLEVERAERVEVDALDLAGERARITGEGLLARAILHECEHLDGQVFLRNVSALRREMLRRQIRKRIEAGTWHAA